jgi:hypothetical protein
MQNAGSNAAGRAFPPYPHLGISLWITEPASRKAFSVAERNFHNTFNWLDEEAACG